MARCDIRGMNEEEILKLDRLAAKKNISREEYLRRLVRRHLLSNEIKETENRYENLVNIVADVVQNNADRMEELTKVIRGLEDEKKYDE